MKSQAIAVNQSLGFWRSLYGVLVCLLWLALMAPASAQQSDGALAQKIADHFSQIKTMTGDFVQYNPKGDISQGTFYLERPGKIRFSYTTSPLRVISDGQSVAINNRKLDTWDLYKLSQTPLKMLLDNRLDLSQGRLVGVTQIGATITLVLQDKTADNSRIKMVFDSKTYSLLQWTITDKQNLTTTVAVKNVRAGVRFANNMFEIPYQRISMKRDAR